MEHHKYLIVGGGITADSAVPGIREMDCNGSIGLIGAETVEWGGGVDPERLLVVH